MKGFFLTYSLLLLLMLNVPLLIAPRGLAQDLIVSHSYLTHDKNESNDMKEFSCEDTIFLFLELNVPAGDHTLLVKWANRENKERENQIYRIKRLKNCPKCQFWIIYNFKTDSHDPLLGPELRSLSFIGNWQVEIYLNENFLLKKDFRVNC